MATYRIKTPDGGTYNITEPDISPSPTPPPDPDVMVRELGKKLDTLPAGGGASLGEVLGGVAGTAVMPGAGTAIGGALGAGAGQAVEDLFRTGSIRPGVVFREAGLSLVPEALESAGRSVVRNIARSSAGGQIIRFAEAARRAREKLPGVFQPPAKAEVDAAFDALRKSGVSLDMSEFAEGLRSLEPGKYGELLTEVKRVDRNLKTGGRFAAMVDRMRKATETVKLAPAETLRRLHRTGEHVTEETRAVMAPTDVGDMQTLRSELRKRVEDLEPVEAKQLLKDFQRDIDGAIDDALVKASASGTDISATAARDARRMYARFRASEDMAHTLEQHIISTPDIAIQKLNLRSFFDEIRKNSTGRAKDINRALDLTPGARDAFQRELGPLAEQFRTIEMPMSGVSGFRRAFLIGGISNLISDILVTETGRKLFSQAILHGRGTLQPNVVAAIANIVRRQAMPAEGMPGAQEGTIQVPMGLLNPQAPPSVVLPR